MSFNRRRHANTVPLLSLATWILVLAFICAAGLGYVYCKNQLHRSGAEIKKLERELAVVQTACDVAKTRIINLSSRTEMQRKLSSGFIKLQPITDDRIIRVSNRPATAAESAVRPVVNERKAP